MTATLSPPVTLTIARSSLRAALGKLLSVVDTTAKALPLAQHILVETRAGSVTLSAMDFNAFVRLTLSCDCADDASALLPAKLFAEIVANLPPVNAVTLAFDGLRSVLTAGRSRFELSGLPVETYPEWPAVPRASRLTVDSLPLLDALTRVATHASDAESRPILNAVLVEEACDALFVVGSSGQSLALLPGGSVLSGALMGPILIHRLDVERLARIFGLDGSTPLTLSADEHRLHVEGGAVSASVRLVEGPFPQYRQILTEAPTHTIVCDRQLLASAVKRASIATDNTRRVALTFADELQLRAAYAGVSAASDAVPLERHERADETSEPLSLMLNAGTFATALATLDTDSLQITAQSPDRPVFLRAADQSPTDPSVVVAMSLRPV
jgi:DNA polymerase-3 subunit beta